MDFLLQTSEYVCHLLVTHFYVKWMMQLTFSTTRLVKIPKNFSRPDLQVTTSINPTFCTEKVTKNDWWNPQNQLFGSVLIWTLKLHKLKLYLVVKHLSQNLHVKVIIFGSKNFWKFTGKLLKNNCQTYHAF